MINSYLYREVLFSAKNMISKQKNSSGESAIYLLYNFRSVSTSTSTWLARAQEVKAGATKANYLLEDYLLTAPLLW